MRALQLRALVCGCFLLFAPKLTVCGFLDALLNRGAASKFSDSQYSAICVVAKNENRYLREWLEYHRCLGTWLTYLPHNQA